MRISGIRSRTVALALCLGAMGALIPSLAWAHGDGPLAYPALQPSALQLGLLPLLILSTSLAVHLVRHPSRSRLLGRIGGDPLVWSLAGLFALHLIALPPHLVHHISRPQAEAVNCAHFLLGSSTEQGSIAMVTLGEEPGFIGDVAAPGLTPVLSRPAPSISGRSPPDLFV